MFGYDYIRESFFCFPADEERQIEAVEEKSGCNSADQGADNVNPIEGQRIPIIVFDAVENLVSEGHGWI